MPLTQVDQGLLSQFAQYTGFKNRIINGAMVIDQRNNGAATASSYTGYVLDRWSVNQITTGKLVAQQNAGGVTPPAGFKNYLGVTSQSAYSVATGDLFWIQQNIEGYNVADLMFGTSSAATVTFSFWVRSSLTGTFGGCLSNSGTRSYPFTYTINSANTWEFKTVTIPGDQAGTWPTTNGVGLSVFFGLGSGSTYSGTAGSWQNGNFGTATGAVSVVGTNGATFYITGVQLEKGSTATSFDYRPYGTEFALCQRYYQAVSGMNMPGGIKSTSDLNRELNIWFPVIMRTSPTPTVTWNTGAQTGNDWVGTNGLMSYKSVGDTTTQIIVTAWTATAEL